MENQGNKWYKEDEDNLLHDIHNNKSIDTIANKYKRTKNAIRSRLKKIAMEMYNNCINMDMITTKTTITETELKKYIANKDTSKNKEIPLKSISNKNDDIQVIKENIDTIINELQKINKRLDNIEIKQK